MTVGAACGNSVDRETRDTSTTVSALTSQDCKDKPDTCDDGSIFGFPVPKEVADIVEELRACAKGAQECADAEDPRACWSEPLKCMAAVFDVEVPNVQYSASTCVEDAISCANEGTTREALAACAQSLQQCGIQQVKTSSPELAGTFESIQACTTAWRECVAKDPGGEQAGACADEQTKCIAKTLKVELPDTKPVSDYVQCASKSRTCLTAAVSFEAALKCGDELRQCTGAPAIPTACQERWDACVADSSNIVTFFECASKLSGTIGP
jgi:hypothetical protein